MPLPSKGTNRAQTLALAKVVAGFEFPMVRVTLWVPAVTGCTPVVEQFYLLLKVWVGPAKLICEILKVPDTVPPSTVSAQL